MVSFLSALPLSSVSYYTSLRWISKHNWCLLDPDLGWKFLIDLDLWCVGTGSVIKLLFGTWPIMSTETFLMVGQLLSWCCSTTIKKHSLLLPLRCAVMTIVSVCSLNGYPLTVTNSNFHERVVLSVNVLINLLRFMLAIAWASMYLYIILYIILNNNNNKKKKKKKNHYRHWY